MQKKQTSLIILGRSGCGKGTQIKFLKKHLNPKHKVAVISGGQLLRNLIKKENSSTTNQLRKTMGLGNLVPSWLIMFMYLHKIIACGHIDKFLIFDGVRKIAEAKLLTEILEWHERALPVCIHLDVPEKEVVKRLQHRKHVHKRHDDHDEAIKRRMKFFKTEVMPTLKYFEKENRLITINGHDKPEIIFENIKAELKIRKLI